MKNFTKRVRRAFGLGLMGLVFGTVTGRVVDTDSLQPIAGATITLGNIVAVTAAIDKGGFVLRNVPLGTRTLTIRAVGWKSYQTKVTVTQDQPADIGTIGLPSALSR